MVVSTINRLQKNMRHLQQREMFKLDGNVLIIYEKYSSCVGSEIQCKTIIISVEMHLNPKYLNEKVLL